MNIRNKETGIIKDIESVYAKRLIEKGTHEEFIYESKEPIHKDVTDAPEVIEPKKKGNPNWGKRQ